MRVKYDTNFKHNHTYSKHSIHNQQVVHRIPVNSTDLQLRRFHTEVKINLNSATKPS